MDSTTQMKADLATMTTDLESALRSASWCSVVLRLQHLEWANVLRPTGRVVRKLRGRKMRSWDALMDEIGAVLQFPDYFGENYPALDECLNDMDWLPTEVGYAVIVVDPLEVLADEPVEGDDPARTLGALVHLFGRAAASFAEPVDEGEHWDRPAVSFDVVLIADPDQATNVRAQWSRAGAPLSS